MGYIGPKGYGFSAVLVIDRVSISAKFGHFGHKWGINAKIIPMTQCECLPYDTTYLHKTHDNKI